MAFLRRKSAVYHEDIYLEDSEPQRRRRLSKIPTNSSAASLATLATLTSQRNVNRRKSFVTVGGLSHGNDFLNEMEDDGLVSVTELQMAGPKPKKSRVALMALRFESQNTQAVISQATISQASLSSPTASVRPALSLRSAMNAAKFQKPSMSSIGSHDRLDAELGTVSSSSSLEDLVEDPAPPPRRIASFTPGIATRQHSAAHEVISEETESAIDLEIDATPQARPKKHPRLSGVEDQTLDLHQRSGSPAELDLGQFGPLRVVNGASSPAPSDKPRVNRPLWLPTERRDTSSLYPESEFGTIKSRKTTGSEWEDEPLSPGEDADNKQMPDMRRAFSFMPGSESEFNGQQPGTGRSMSKKKVPTEMNSAESMANDYMGIIPTSPFARSPTLPNISHTDDEHDLNASPLATAQQAITSSPPRHDHPSTSPASQSSVRRYEEHAYSQRSFLDETLGGSPPPEEEVAPAPVVFKERGSPVSFYSAPESDNVEEPFRSAVELQTSRNHSRSPYKHLPGSPAKSTAKPLPHRMNTKSDSGYSSNTSLSTAILPLEAHIDSGNDYRSGEDAKKLKFPFRKHLERSGRGVIIKPTLSKKVPLPSAAQIESASALTSTTSLNSSAVNTVRGPPAETTQAPPAEKERPRKKLQKQRRKSSVDVARELVIQRLPSRELFDVPPVSNTTRSALAQRNEKLPELERTFRTQNATAHNASASVLSIATPMPDLRFPSPVEEDERKGRSRSKSRNRGRSLSRPRTWFGWSKDSSSDQKSAQKNADSGAEIGDLGSIADLLGDNPYDIATERPKNSMPPSAWNGRPDYMRMQTTPSNITIARAKPKPTMDDQTASAVSKLRRRSLSANGERVVKVTGRHSFDDRGGIPGRLPSSSITSMDVPPLPPMPTSEEIDRRFTYLNMSPTDEDVIPSRPLPRPELAESMPVARQQGFRRNQVYEHEFSDDSRHQTEAPPPPPHSPEPSYVEDRDFYNDFSDGQAPPPPCHSPRPMDVTPGQNSRNVSWTNQANAWKERRQSAGAMLRQSWHQEDEHYVPTAHSSSPREPLHHQQYYADEGQIYYQQNQYENHYSHGDTRSHSYVGYDDYADNHSTLASSPRSNRRGYGSTGGSSRPSSFHEQSQWTDEYRAGWEAAQAQTRVLNDFPSPPRFYGNYNHHADPRNQPPPRAQTYDGSSRSRQHHPHPLHHHPPHPPRALPRPNSQHSQLSHHSHHSHTSRRSLAEELHPDHDLTSSPSGSAISRTANPLIGRYSGGLEYNYDRYARGFDGSAGSRSASTAKGQNVKRDGKKRSSWLDMESYGVDLGDVPPMSVPVGAVGSKMMYH